MNRSDESVAGFGPGRSPRRLLAATLALVCAGCATGRGDAPATASVRDLEEGRRVYRLHCSRCHGPDGKDDTYPFIATLDGIGTRMTTEEILRATWATGFASPDDFTEDERRALAAFVAKL